MPNGIFGPDGQSFSISGSGQDWHKVHDPETGKTCWKYEAGNFVEGYGNQLITESLANTHFEKHGLRELTQATATSHKVHDFNSPTASFGADTKKTVSSLYALEDTPFAEAKIFSPVELKNGDLLITLKGKGQGVGSRTSMLFDVKPAEHRRDLYTVSLVQVHPEMGIGHAPEAKVQAVAEAPTQTAPAPEPSVAAPAQPAPAATLEEVKAVPEVKSAAKASKTPAKAIAGGAATLGALELAGAAVNPNLAREQLDAITQHPLETAGNAVYAMLAEPFKIARDGLSAAVVGVDSLVNGKDSTITPQQREEALTPSSGLISLGKEVYFPKDDLNTLERVEKRLGNLAENGKSIAEYFSGEYKITDSSVTSHDASNPTALSYSANSENSKRQR